MCLLPSDALPPRADESSSTGCRADSRPTRWVDTVAARVSSYLSARYSLREAGATAVEYGLLIALIAAAIFVAVFTLGITVGDAFTDFNSRFVTP